MFNNTFAYLLMFYIFGVSCFDAMFYPNLLLQILVVICLIVILALSLYIAYKTHYGNYLSNEQIEIYFSYLYENVVLRSEILALESALDLAKKKPKFDLEIQQIVATNQRVIAQNQRLKTVIIDLNERIYMYENSQISELEPKSTAQKSPAKATAKSTAKSKKEVKND